MQETVKGGNVPSMVDTPTFRLADVVLGGKLRQILRSYVAKGWTAEQIARELYLKTDGQVGVTGQTIRAWLRQLGYVQPPEEEAV